MKLACPSCQQDVTVLELDGQLSAEVVCNHCNANVGITVATTILDAGHTPPNHERPTEVVVAVADDGLREAYSQALTSSGFAVRQTGMAREALQIMGKQVPAVCVIDGSFAPIFGMGLGEIIKKSGVTRSARVVGLRTDDQGNLPVPGADRTLALTCGGEAVVTAVAALKDGLASPPLTQPTQAPGLREARHPAPMTAPAIATAPAAALAAPPVSDGERELESARRLARIIISDVALYNQKAVDRGLQTGNLRQAIEPFLDEGRDHYISRVSESLRRSHDFFDEAVDQFIRRKEASMKPAAA